MPRRSHLLASASSAWRRRSEIRGTTRALVAGLPLAIAGISGCPSATSRMVLVTGSAVAVALSPGCWNNSSSPPVSDYSPKVGTSASPQPTTAPSSSQTLEPGSGQISWLFASALNGGSLTFRVKEAGTGAALDGARVSAIGPSLAEGIADQDGNVALQPLATGTYEIRIEASGHVPFAGSAALEQARQRVTQDCTMSLAGATLTGRVRDGAGQPLAGARVAQGTACAMTDQDGRYTLPVPTAGSATVCKTGFTPATTPGGDLTLAALSPRRVSFENAPFGVTASTAFATLRSGLASAGWSAADGDPAASVRIWAAPRAVTAEQASAAAQFVRDGGKLIVMADWGGAASYDPVAANRLMVPLGAAVGTDLVRCDASTLGTREWIVPVLSDVPPAAGIAQIDLLGAATVRAAAPATLVAIAPTGGYRVQAVADDLPVIVARQVGTGLLVVLGDTSAWLDADIGRANNLAFLESLIAW